MDLNEHGCEHVCSLTHGYPPLVNVNDAMRMMGNKSRGKIYKLIDLKKIDSVKDGSRRLIVTKSIYAYIESLEHSMAVGIAEKILKQQEAKN